MSESYFNLFNAIETSSFIVKLVLFLLLLLSIYSWTIMIGKSRLIRVNSKLVNNLRKQIKENKNDYNLLLTKFNSYKNNPYVNILKFLNGNNTILVNKGTINTVVADTVYNVLYEINKPLETKLTSLATIGNGAPFIGLFGTVIGIINSFTTIGTSSSASLSVIAPGIAEALYTTAFGLFVAVPAVFGYNNLTTKLEDYKDRQSILIQEMVILFIKTNIESSKFKDEDKIYNKKNNNKDKIKLSVEDESHNKGPLTNPFNNN